MTKLVAPAGLRLPFLSEADPELAGEGSLDPLALAALADRLADLIAPGVTARMARIRFVTTIAVAAVALEDVSDVAEAAGIDAYLAFEWLLVEAHARQSKLPQTALLRVPGTDKARAAIGRGERLGLANYLKTPKVFGFHGIYKRLARSFGTVDSELHNGAAGEDLVAMWQREQGLPGFLEARPGTSGESLRRRIAGEVNAALGAGSVTTRPSQWIWTELVAHLRVDAIGKKAVGAGRDDDFLAQRRAEGARLPRSSAYPPPRLTTSMRRPSGSRR